MRYLAIVPVQLYRWFVSPLFPNTCKYYPSCSRYAIDALRQHGVLRGSILAGWRLLRCNPWSHGGVDHVRPRGENHVSPTSSVLLRVGSSIRASATAGKARLRRQPEVSP